MPSYDYESRHQHPVNRLLHKIGIPMIVASLVIVFFHWKIALFLFVTGWILQFVGHAFEGKNPAFFDDPRHLLNGVLWWFKGWKDHPKMDASYWNEKWSSGDTLFDQGSPNPFLVKYFNQCVPNPTTVFVPLCGKSIDMEWLVKQGHKVIGVESNQPACEAFFRERNLAFESSQVGSLTVFSSDHYKIYCGDFFHLRSVLLDGADVVYDRAALVALSPDVRIRYFKHMAELLEDKGKIFLITYEYNQSEVEPPPFAVLDEEVCELASDFSKIQLIERNVSDPKQLKNPKFQQATTFSENVYWITR